MPGTLLHALALLLGAGALTLSIVLLTRLPRIAQERLEERIKGYHADWDEIVRRTQRLRDDAREYLEAGERKRARAAATMSRMNQAGNGHDQEPGHLGWSRDDYLAHLERGGRVLPDLESRFTHQPPGADD